MARCVLPCPPGHPSFALIKTKDFDHDQNMSHLFHMSRTAFGLMPYILEIATLSPARRERSSILGRCDDDRSKNISLALTAVMIALRREDRA